MKQIPQKIRSEKEKLINLIAQNKKKHESILSNLLKTEQKDNETNKQLKLEEVRLNELREDKIRKEGIIATHKETLKQINEQVRERLGISPDELSKIANIKPDQSLPSAEDLEKKLERLIKEQEKLGGVNLLAEQEVYIENLDYRELKLENYQWQELYLVLLNQVGKEY